MHDLDDKEIVSEDTLVEIVIGDEVAEAAAEAAAAETPFDEEQLLELAKNEGLLDEVQFNDAENNELPADPQAKLEMSETDQANIMASMETILFMSDKPVSLPKLRSTINTETPIAAYRILMARLRSEFNLDHRGVEIAEVSMGFQLRTKPHMATVLRKMVKTQPLRLSGATMEVLSVIAYKQPVTKDEVDQIRGVDSGYVLRNLMEKRLVRIAGRSDLPGKPMVYGTTHEFLELFNMKDTKALPPLHEVESMVAASEVGYEEKTQAVMEEFGKMVATADKVLFDDSQIDTELEALRAEIAAIPTSTAFIDAQKTKEKLDARLVELAAQGLTLDAEGKVVPIGSVSEHQPSAELTAEAEAAQWERHAALIAQAIGETQLEGDIAVVDASALADVMGAPKVEHEAPDVLAEQESEPEVGI